AIIWRLLSMNSVVFLVL
ncbi:CBS domain protein, partial [Vibrio parahaemolyticus VPTS-2010]